MPTCSVYYCINKSSVNNFRSHGITYHKFPRNPKIKEKWIDATGRPDDWFPTKNSTICSAHFEETCFQISEKSRRLFPGVIPNLNLRVMSVDVSDQAKSFEPIDAIPQNSVCNETKRNNKLKELLQRSLKTIRLQKNKIKRLQSTERRSKKKIISMENLFKELQQNKMINTEHILVLESTNAVVKDLITRCTKKTEMCRVSKSKYSVPLRSFALTLHFYSPKAYQYVRRKFETLLPHPRTIQKWYESVNGSPGFTKESFNALKIKVASVDYTLICNLVIDEMAIRPKIEWDGYKTYGLIDFGNTALGRDNIAEAKQALVFLVTAINGAFKVPVGYFLVDGVTGEQRANLVRQCLKFLHPSGIIIRSLTFDGCPSNISMAKVLGVIFEYENMKTEFEHPVTKSPVQIFLDATHMLKLVRNTFQVNGTFINQYNQSIHWQYLEKLNEKQEKEHLHLANHIFYQNQNMKVRLASHLFSNSVADALLFCSKLELTQFDGVEATVEFLRVFNNLFDILNSRNMKQLHFKKPINPNNKEDVFQTLNDSEAYIKTLKQLDGKFILEGSRKMGFIGFIVCIRSLKKLYSLVGDENKLEYLPAYKVSQDHIKLMFGQIRSHGGCSNPTARQFQVIYKKLLVKSERRDLEFGNCRSLESLSLLHCSSAVEHINNTTEKQMLMEEPETETERFAQQVFDAEIEILVNDITEFSSQAITYIAGLVVHALLKEIKCDTCVTALLADHGNCNHKLIQHKDKGGLLFPSNDVIDICKKIESVIKQAVLCQPLVNKYKQIKEKLASKALVHFIGKKIFSCIDFHQYDQSPLENHVIHLIKAVMEKYIDVRLHHIFKTQMFTLSKRQVLNKYLHFTGQ